MSRQSGDRLEAQGLDVLTRLGMPAIGNLPQVLLRDFDPEGDHSRDDHCEFDYLIPNGNTCLVGEITDRNAKNVGGKFTHFRRVLDVVRRVAGTDGLSEDQWTRLGVPKSRVGELRTAREIKGFFIATNHEQFDDILGGRSLNNVAVFYRPDWFLLCSYADTLGTYGRNYLDAALGIEAHTGRGALRLTKAEHSLIVLSGKSVALGVGARADVYTFDISPYRLLPMAHVFRRDLLPDLSIRRLGNYQRPLIADKLKEIRKMLRSTRDFLFPSNILVTLGEDCRYDSHSRNLIIPERYGAVEVIDGQHRLFSYADNRVRRARESDATIMVTAIQFKGQRPSQLNRSNARIFVEINGNQTRISPSHLDAIAYPILGETSPSALAAEVIARLNKNGRTRGLFKTSQTRRGVIRPATVAREIRPIVSLEALRQLKPWKNAARLRGYRNLLGANQAKLRRAETLIVHTTEALAQYFSRAAGVFSRDWPSRNIEHDSALEYAKVFAALVMLFDKFLSDGLNWEEVQQQLTTIRDNILRLRDLTSYETVLLADHTGIPDSGPTVQDDFKFFDANRHAPTPIQDVITARRRPQRHRGRSRR